MELHRLVRCCDFENLRFLLKSNVDINVTDSQSRTALHWAVIFSNIKITKLLIKYDIDMNIQDVKGRTALHLAVEMPNLQAIKILLKTGSQLNLKDKFDRTPLTVGLHSTHYLSNREAVSLLIEAGTDLTIKYNNQQTSLHIAVNTLNIIAVTLMLDKHAKINEQDKNGCTALDYAKKLSNLEIVNILRSRGGECEIQEDPWHMVSMETRIHYDELISSLKAKSMNKFSKYEIENDFSEMKSWEGDCRVKEEQLYPINLMFLNVIDEFKDTIK